MMTLTLTPRSRATSLSLWSKVVLIRTAFVTRSLFKLSGPTNVCHKKTITTSR